MRTAVAESSIDCYHHHVVPNLKASQNERVMAVIKPKHDYSLTELMQLVPGVDKSSMSRIINDLRTAGRLTRGPMRKCTITNIQITPSRLPSVQFDLFS